MRRHPPGLSLVGALLVAAACTDTRPRAEPVPAAARSVRESPEAAFRASIGRTWELARLGTQEIPAPGVRADGARPGRHPGPGTRPTLRFTTDSAGAIAGGSGLPGASGSSFCNGYGTAYELGPGDRLRFHGFHSTLVGCNGPDSLETRYFRALHRTQRFEIDGTSLHLVAADGTRLTFVAAPDSARPPSAPPRP